MRSCTFDIETDGLDPSVVWCAAIADHHTGHVKGYGPGRLAEFLSDLDRYNCITGHNCIGYDLPVLRRLLSYVPRQGVRIWDTLIQSRLQRPNRTSPPQAKGSPAPHSVEAWAYRVGERKVEHDDWSHYSEDMLHRCKEDTRIQCKIGAALDAEGKGEGWEKALRLSMRLFHYLQLQQEQGWQVDDAHIDRSLVRLHRWIDRIDGWVNDRLPLVVEAEEHKVSGEYGWVRKPFLKSGKYAKVVEDWIARVGPSTVGGPFSRINFRRLSLDKSEEVKDYLLHIGWEPTEWNTNNNGDKTSPKLSKNDEFVGVQGGLGKLIVKRVQCKQRAGILEGWKAVVTDKQKIHGRVVGLASTGRAKHNIIVNVPGTHAFFGAQMRSVFTASPGMVMVGVDSKGNQLRQLAARVNDASFTDHVLHHDIHAYNAELLGSSRTVAKNFFYGFLFGAQPPKIAKTVGCSIDQARDYMSRYEGKLPGLVELKERLRKEWLSTAKRVYDPKYGRTAYKNGYITGLDGRPILVESPHALLVYLLQSDEAIQMAAAYVWLNTELERRYRRVHDYNMLCWYHDELQYECLPELAAEASALGCEAIAWSGRYYRIACPHEGEAKVGKNWMETH